MTYISKDFQVGYLPYYRLLIGVQFGFDQICVLDDRQSVVAYFRYDPAHPPHDVLPLLSLPFPEVNIIIPQHNVSVIPQAVYDPEDIGTYADSLELKSNVDILVQEVDDFGVNVLYQLDSVSYHRWKKVYPEASYVSSFSALFKQAALHKQEAGATFFVQYGNQDTVDVLLTKDGNMLFLNSFIINGEEDLVYYLLQIQKQFDLTEPVQKIYGLGRITDESWFLTLSRCCEELIANDGNHHIEFPEELSKEAVMEVNHLFQNSACGSLVAK